MLAAHVKAEGFGEPARLSFPDDGPRLEHGDTLGRYEIDALIGTGGMGEVYRARDTRLNRTVAIKLFVGSAYLARDDARARFEREAKMIAALNHPHICTLYDISPPGGIDYLVMEHLEGQTLAARLEDGGTLLDESLRYALEIADAMAAAHSRDITHRDIKPSNIMLTASGAKLLDFGVAKSFIRHGSSSGATSLTADRGPVGTPRYMAPEVLSGGKADLRADLFAFGAVMYEMVTGRPAFPADSFGEAVAAIMATHPPPLSTTRPGCPCRARRPGARVPRQGPGTPVPGRIGARRTTSIPLAAGRASRFWTRRHRRRFTQAVIAAAGLVFVVTAAVMMFRRPSAASLTPSLHVAALACEAPPAVALDTVALCNGLTDVLMTRLLRLTASHPVQVTPFSEGFRRGIRTLDGMRTGIGATRVLTTVVQSTETQTHLEYQLSDPRSTQTD